MDKPVSDFSAVEICEILQACKKTHTMSLRYKGLELNFSDSAVHGDKIVVTTETSPQTQKQPEGDDLDMLLLSDPMAFEERTRELEK